MEIRIDALLTKGELVYGGAGVGSGLGLGLGSDNAIKYIAAYPLKKSLDSTLSATQRLVDDSRGGMVVQQ